MPIYEFYCPDNHRIYSFFARSSGLRDKVPTCPENPAFRMERRLSSFAVTGRAKEESAAGPGDMADDPRMEAAMAEMEREMGSMDEANPDPRRLAQMMRKMAALTGEKMPAEMEEMMRRMELGEDPEKLEEEFGDLLGDDDGGMGMDGMPDGGGAETDTGSKAGKLLRSMSRPPQRDPQLYEMADYLK